MERFIRESEFIKNFRKDLFEKTIDYIYHNYKPQYSISLSFNMLNIARALEVYAFGIDKHLDFRDAIITLYGYRYRRLENFILECGLWKLGIGWLHLNVDIKVYAITTPKSLQKGKFDSAEFTIYNYKIPEHIYKLNKTNEEFLVMLYHVIAERLGEFSFLNSFTVDRKRIGLEIRGFGYTHCCSQVVESDLVWWRFRKYGVKLRHKWRVVLRLANYIIKETKVCPWIKNYYIRKVEKIT
jgi:hypothetical protein